MAFYHMRPEVNERHVCGIKMKINQELGGVNSGSL